MKLFILMQAPVDGAWDCCLFAIYSETPENIQTKYAVDNEEISERYRKKDNGKVCCSATIVNTKDLPNIIANFQVNIILYPLVA